MNKSSAVDHIKRIEVTPKMSGLATTQKPGGALSIAKLEKQLSAASAADMAVPADPQVFLNQFDFQCKYNKNYNRQ